MIFFNKLNCLSTVDKSHFNNLIYSEQVNFLQKRLQGTEVVIQDGKHCGDYCTYWASDMDKYVDKKVIISQIIWERDGKFSFKCRYVTDSGSNILVPFAFDLDYVTDINVRREVNLSIYCPDVIKLHKFKLNNDINKLINKANNYLSNNDINNFITTIKDSINISWNIHNRDAIDYRNAVINLLKKLNKYISLFTTPKLNPLSSETKQIMGNTPDDLMFSTRW